MINVKELVAERLITDAPVVREMVIKSLVQDEQARRVKAVLKVIADLDDTKRAANKIRPDAVSYDEDGNIVTAGYSKAKLEERKKSLDLIAKLEAALNEALDETTPNFEKVMKFSGSGKPATEGKSEE